MSRARLPSIRFVALAVVVCGFACGRSGLDDATGPDVVTGAAGARGSAGTSVQAGTSGAAGTVGAAGSPGATRNSSGVNAGSMLAEPIVRSIVSCLGRRMCDFAAHLRDHVMPRVPVRQWVLTVPHGLRFRMAFNPDVTGLVLRTFVSVVSRWLRRRARAVGIRGGLKTGGVTVIQRFGSALNLNVHFHTLMIDGVYELRLGGPPIFHPVASAHG